MLNRDFHIREIMKMPIEKRWELPEGGLWITFDDGQQVPMKTRKVVYGSYYNEMMQEFGGDMLPKHQLLQMVDGKWEEQMFKDGVHLKLSEQVFWDSFSNTDQSQETVWKMSKRIYEITNDIYNYSVLELLRYMSTMDLEDVMDIQLHPKIVKLHKNYITGLITAQECHDRMYRIIETDTEYFGDNDVHLSVRAGLLSNTQVKQQHGPRANVPDINSVAFKHTIDCGYIDRLNYAYDSLIESRTASIAIYMQSGPLEQSEYNNRMCQLLCGVLNEVTYGVDSDCGTKFTVKWTPFDDDSLKVVKGKYHVLEDGKIEMLNGTEQHLIGKTLSIRSLITCGNHKQGSVCQTCLGFNAFIIPPKASYGHVLSIDTLGQISQTILSTKHVISNVKPLCLEITGRTEKYLKQLEDDKFKLQLRKPSGNLSIRVISDEAAFISDIFVENVNLDEINAAALTDLTEIQFIYYDDKGIEVSEETIDITVANTGAVFSKEMLAYLKEHRWDLVNNNQLEINLDKWDYNDIFLYTKRVSQDITATLNAFKGFVSPPNDVKKRKGKGIDDCSTPEEALLELYTIMSDKLKVNFNHLEVFIKPLMTRMTNYGLPKPGEDFRFIKLTEAISNRSGSSALGFQGQATYIASPSSYLVDPASIPDSPLDGIFSKTHNCH